MPTHSESAQLDVQIDQWRNFLRNRRAIQAVDVVELEDHLREQISNLTESGLAADEAFLVAVKRIGRLDALSNEFAREHSERLWKQLVLAPADAAEPQGGITRDAIVVFSLALAAALLVKLPALFGIPMVNANEEFYLRNASLFVLPLLTAYFAWKRNVAPATLRWLAVVFVAAGVFANVALFAHGGTAGMLGALHLPIALWIAVGVAYAGARWKEVAGRMDFIRFSGELFIYYVLIALGGGVFTGFMMMIFEAIGITLQPFVQSWLIPCGAAGAVLVASWLVEAKQSVIENMVPVLTRLFTPLFAVMLVAFLGTMLWTGRGVGIQRDVLIGFDLLLAIVVALLLYSVSARDPRAPAGAFDVVQIVLIVSALVADLVALWAIGARISDFGFSANRVAALGENIILLVNLSWSAVVYIRFLRGRGSFTSLERWQTGYLPVYAAWAAIVVIAFPLVFRNS